MPALSKQINFVIQSTGTNATTSTSVAIPSAAYAPGGGNIFNSIKEKGDVFVPFSYVCAESAVNRTRLPDVLTYTNADFVAATVIVLLAVLAVFTSVFAAVVDTMAYILPTGVIGNVVVLAECPATTSIIVLRA